tara:strand:+ start:2646 stop:3305 length:660 start_codon:yes stop_codon:yes gene_type:complete
MYTKDFYAKKNKKNCLIIKLLPFFIFLSFPLNAHTFTGMVGFYDGLSHPVLGLDHFLAMVSVGIISAQIGGRAIWTVPSIFVSLMLIGGMLGMIIEVNSLDTETIFSSNITLVIELGIIFSVILLGLAIAIQKSFSINIIMIFVSLFGLCHGLAHGMEIPWAANPILFALGFSLGTATLHLFGVGIGLVSFKSNLSNILLRFTGIIFAIYGVYLLIPLN